MQADDHLGQSLLTQTDAIESVEQARRCGLRVPVTGAVAAVDSAPSGVRFSASFEIGRIRIIVPVGLVDGVQQPCLAWRDPLFALQCLDPGPRELEHLVEDLERLVAVDRLAGCLCREHTIMN
jgi:hypothetical protein